MTGQSPLRGFIRWIDLRWLIGILIAAAAVVVPVVPLLTQDGGSKRIDLSPPSAQPTTLGDLLRSHGEPLGNTPPRLLHQAGFVVSADLTAAGYDGQNLSVLCTVTDDRTDRQSSNKPHGVRATGGPETTQPCWLPRPGPVTDTYTVAVEIDDHNGNQLRVSDTKVGG
jgi:hypothetical protein